MLPGSRGKDEGEGLRWADVPRILIFFHLICFTWIFFRAENFAEAIDFITRIATGTYHRIWPWFQVIVVSFCMLSHVLERFARLRFDAISRSLDNRWGGALEGALLGVIAGLIALFGTVGGEFIYFQF